MENQPKSALNMLDLPAVQKKIRDICSDILLKMLDAPDIQKKIRDICSDIPHKNENTQRVSPDEVTQPEKTCKEKDDKIARLEKACKDKDDKIARLEKACKDKDTEITQLKEDYKDYEPLKSKNSQYIEKYEKYAKYAKIEELYQKYYHLSESIHEDLRRVLSAESPEKFMCYGLQWCDLEALWDALSHDTGQYSNEEFAVLSELFDYFFDLYKETKSNYSRLEVNIGDDFDEYKHTRASDSAVSGKIKEIVLKGYIAGSRKKNSIVRM